MKLFFRLSSDLEPIPHDEKTVEWMVKRKPGEIFSFEVKNARNYENHKRFFSFIDQTFDMQEHFENKEIYRKWITMKCGHFDTIVTPKGDTIFAAKSIAFERMEEEEFKELFSSAIDVFLRELGKDVSEHELMKVINYC